MIEIVILYILNKYDATIYRIGKIINEYFFAYLKSSTGTVSPALKRLENLGLVEYKEKMTEGGMLSKMFSITQAGREYLIQSLLTVKEENSYHILNTIKIALFCSDVLSVNELIEFKENLLNILTLYKIKLEKGINNAYVDFNEVQTQTLKATLIETESLIKLL